MTEVVAPPDARAEPEAHSDTPFVGLRPFRASEADFFFGRAREVRVLAANLRAVRLTLLYGPSGVGKSSILHAGVAEELRHRARRNLARRGHPGLAVAVFDSWRGDPVAGLVDVVEREVAALGVEAERRSNGDKLGDALADLSGAVQGPILVVLDGFEEYFHYHGDERGEGSFALEFAEAVTRPDIRANFLLAIREDEYAKLDLFTEQIPELFENYIRLDHLDVESARAAIYGPIEEYNQRHPGSQVAIEPELVEAILEQVRPRRLAFAYTAAGDVDAGDGDRIAAPFLQLVLQRLWAEEQAGGSNVLRRSTLERLGETQGIVEAHVRRGLAALSEPEQDIAAQAFRFLATSSGTKVAHTAADLAEFTGIRERTLERVLDKLVSAETRILNRLPPSRPDGAPSYELYHDLLAEAVLAWRSDRLGAMETRAAKAEAREARRRANRFRLVAAAAVVAAAVCLVLLVVALRAKHTADEAKKTARAQEFVAESEATLPTDPDGALRKAELALEEVKKPTAQAEFAYRTAVGASQLRVAIRHKYGAMQGATYSRSGSRVMALGTDDTASVSDARTGRLISSIGYGVPLRTADLSRDGKILVTAGNDDTVRFWNASTGARLGSFRNPSLVGAWLDPANPRRAVAAGSDGALRIWRLGASRPLVLRQRGVRLTEAAFSPNGAMVAAIGFSPRTWLFDARTGKLLHTLAGHIRNVHALAWSPDSRRLVTGGDDGRWFVWEVATGSTHLGNDDTGPITAVAFSSDGGYVATASGNQASVWELVHATRIAQLVGHSGSVTDVDFNPGGHLLLTSSTDGTARIWNLATETTLTELRGNGGAVSSAVFSPNGKFVLTASDDQAARIWDVDTGRALWAHQSAVTDARFALGGTVVATGGVDQLVVFSRTRTGAAISQLPKDGAVHSIRFSRDGKLLAVATDDPNLVVRNADTGVPIATLQGNVAAVAGAVFNPKGTEVAVGDNDGSAGIFQARTGRLVRWLHEKGQQRAHPLGRVNGIDWSPDGRYVVTAGSDQEVRVWDGRSGRHLWTFSGHVGSVTSIAFALHGDQIVTTGLDRTAIVWDVQSHKRLALLRGDPQPLYSASFSPDGQWVATGDSGGVVRVWDLKDRKMLAAIPAHAGPVNAVTFSPDGKQILSASDDWSAKIYSCTTCIPNLDDLRARILRREKLIT